MNKLLKATVSFTFVGLAFFMMTMTTHAGNYTILDYDNFDYTRYADDYPDLYAVYGYNKDALYAHYANLGENENRKAHIDRRSFLTAANFNAFRYASDYPDLAASLGTDATVLYNHYITVGYQEQREAHSTDSDVEAVMQAFDIVSDITTDSMSDYQKIRAIHDWLCMNLIFDYNNYMAGTVSDVSKTYVGAINNRVAVSGGYSEAFDVLARAAGIDSRVVTGTAFYVTGYSAQSWNIVKMDGSWYAIDVTWDDPIPDKAGRVDSYEYFLLTIEQMAKNHTTS